ncbi:MAG: helix-hairpin-helix domain-containing protein [Actinomycetota bacterium]
MGPARRRLLLQQFGSPKGLSKATKEEIASVPGIGRDLAGRIYEFLKTAV